MTHTARLVRARVLPAFYLPHLLHRGQVPGLHRSL